MGFEIHDILSVCVHSTKKVSWLLDQWSRCRPATSHHVYGTSDPMLQLPELVRSAVEEVSWPENKDPKENENQLSKTSERRAIRVERVLDTNSLDPGSCSDLSYIVETSTSDTTDSSLATIAPKDHTSELFSSLLCLEPHRIADCAVPGSSRG